MKMNPKATEQIEKAVKEITDNYQSNEVLMAKGECRLPSRSTIILMIKELRRVMFPGYFGEENLSDRVSDYFVGSHINRIYLILKEQIVTALVYHHAVQMEQKKQKEDLEVLSCEQAEHQAEEICQHFVSRLPYIQQMLLKDVQAGFDGDPAAQSKEDIVVSYPGMFAIYVYRIAHVLYQKKVPYIPRIMTEYAHSRTGIDINAGAEIGEYFFIDHGTGVVIGETTRIGNHVKLYQGVTLGALSTRMGQQLAGIKRHPTIEDYVTVYSGSTILGGDTVIGEGSIIGGNAFITESIDSKTKVIVKKPEMTFQGEENKPFDIDTWIWEI